MKKPILASLALALLLAACAAPAEPTWHTITAEQAHAIMAETDAFILLDVRTPAEFRAHRIPGAQLIPYDEIISRAGELPAQNAVILIYCRTGRRSAIAAAALAQRGFTNIHDFGGIYDWPFDITSGGESNHG